MAKSFTAGNGNILVGFDENALVRDFYFPHVGQENHVGGDLKHRLAVRVDGRTYFFEDDFDVNVRCSANTLSGKVVAKNEGIGITITIDDVVYNEKNILIRSLDIHNERDTDREITVFFCHEFHIGQKSHANTAYYDPRRDALIHYRGRRAFLINALDDEGSFDQYTTGVFGINNRKGSYTDTYDGELSGNPIEHGPCDSCIGITRTVDANDTHSLHYWIAAGRSIQETFVLDNYVLGKTPAHLVDSTQKFWEAWLTRRDFNLTSLSRDMKQLFNRSLLTLRSHVGANGAIIASSDSDTLQYDKDTYVYVWPRDGAYCANALDASGDWNIAQGFFEFMEDVMKDEGYFMHKYNPDKSLGSSWHPWLRDGEFQLPIQEDGTALILHGLWKHYQSSRDLEFIEEIYNPLILNAAEFLVHYRDSNTGLPKPSYDLWEEKLGVHTYTAACVYGGLTAVANFARLLGKSGDVKRFRSAAVEVKEGMMKNLVVDGRFIKGLHSGDGKLKKDMTADMSTIFGLLTFGVLPLDDAVMTNTANHIFNRLKVDSEVGGYARYEGDDYYKSDYSDVVGNPWFIATIWHARYHIATAQSRSDLEVPFADLRWVVDHARKSGILSEQVDPETGHQISVAPLAWSHAEYIKAVLAYQKKYRDLKK